METIREYGLELLGANAEVDTVVRACTNYYLPLLDAGEVKAWWPMPLLRSIESPNPKCLSEAELFAQVG